jgi:ligand-binding sensor domain-containing protein
MATRRTILVLKFVIASTAFLTWSLMSNFFPPVVGCQGQADAVQSLSTVPAGNAVWTAEACEVIMYDEMDTVQREAIVSYSTALLRHPFAGVPVACW